MLAVLGKTEEEVRNLLREHPGVFIANINAPGQIIVAGTRDPLEGFARDMRQKQVKTVPLRVSGPFHTPLMEPAVADLKQALADVHISPARAPVYANCTGQPETQPDVIAQNILSQLTGPVRWVETIQRMADAGARLFVEVGPKQVLSGLIARILPGASCINVSGPDSLEKLRLLLAGGEPC